MAAAPRRAAGLLLALAALLAPARGRAGELRGRVQVPQVVRRQTAKNPGAYGDRLAAAPGQETRPRSEAENVVVFLKEKIPGSYRPPARHPVMAQLGASFVPRVLPVLAGTTVDFPNQDPIFHNIFSLSKLATFNLGRFPRGESRSHTFQRPGMVRVNCDIHADMLGYVLVLPHPYFATPDASGAYRITGIPAGRYHLVAWHDTLPPQVRQVVVPAQGALEADFRF